MMARATAWVVVLGIMFASAIVYMVIGEDVGFWIP